MSLRTGVLGTACFLAVCAPGCRTFWIEPQPTSAIAGLHNRLKSPLAATSYRPATPGTPEATLLAASDLADYAARADRRDSDDAVDAHYGAAMASWTALHGVDPHSEQFQLAQDAYQASLARMMITARQAGRFVPGRGLVVQGAYGPIFVPLVLHSAVWQQADVHAIHPVGDYRVSELTRTYRSPGWGVPVVVQRSGAAGRYPAEEFLSAESGFAATALLRPTPGGRACLELYDPLHPAPGATPPVVPLAYDISAPFALRLVSSPALRSDWLSFFGVDRPTREGLFFIEPYQPGKIPIVLVHGVLSNPVAWVDLANDLRAVPGFADRYQLWAFRYATGKPFLESAAFLRRDLYRAAAAVDPAGCDPAMHQVTLIGHSMGGLVSELQAACSGDRLWNAVANRPLGAIVASDASRRALQEMFFFNPQPNVACIISIAAPHQGSNLAARPIGRLGSALAQHDPERVARHAELVRDNPGVFSEELTRGVPTSIDMLEPESAVLQAIAALPRSPRVEYHTIFGYGRWSLGQGPGDGVVPIDSALSPWAASQVGVEAPHTHIHRRLETAQEILRILSER